MIGPDVPPFQGLAFNRLFTQGGAERLTPLRFPWAGMLWPLRGECIQWLREEKGSGTFCAKHPSGRSGKRFLTPFPPQSRRETIILYAGAPGAVPALNDVEAEGTLLNRHPGLDGTL